ncbi:MAG: hypothetical protein O3A28_00545 [Actinomycetota bacterium]|nr:hypothetical protein [Actinomycetota bacterium]MDA3006290.1 hypothetical protein [Actinomycetota bacterium]MDA3033502.1 hypothetical protein [Actinomycetota bacterium]
MAGTSAAVSVMLALGVGDEVTERGRTSLGRASVAVADGERRATATGP